MYGLFDCLGDRYGVHWVSGGDGRIVRLEVGSLLSIVREGPQYTLGWRVRGASAVGGVKRCRRGRIQGGAFNRDTRGRSPAGC